MCELCGSEYLLDYGAVEVCMSCGSVVGVGGVIEPVIEPEKVED